MKEIAPAFGPDRRRPAVPRSGSESDPDADLQALIDGLAALGRLDSDLARFARELGGAAPPGS